MLCIAIYAFSYVYVATLSIDTTDMNSVVLVINDYFSLVL